MESEYSLIQVAFVPLKYSILLLVADEMSKVEIITADIVVVNKEKQIATTMITEKFFLP